MKRRVVKHGSSTLTISLPSKWVKNYNINPGDELEIIEEKGSLIIKGENNESVKGEGVLNCEEVSLLITRAVDALYKAGCDSIRIFYPNKEAFKIIEEYVPQLIGFEIMQQTSHSCLLKEISHPIHDVSIEEVVRRIFILIISVFDDFLAEGISTGNKEILFALIKRDEPINKLCSYARRLLSKKGYSQSKNLPFLYYIIEESEKFADVIKAMSKYLLVTKKITDQDIVEITKEVCRLYKEFTQIYFKFSALKVNNFVKEFNLVKEQIESRLSTKNIHNLRILIYLAQACEYIFNMIGPLLAAKLPDVCKVEAEKQIKVAKMI